jgi:hypothetical protein
VSLCRRNAMTKLAPPRPASGGDPPPHVLRDARSSPPQRRPACVPRWRS